MKNTLSTLGMITQLIQNESHFEEKYEIIVSKLTKKVVDLSDP